ncbi:hypothetical protein RN001_003514 [Aquatica leii]|uniref:Uncharacterized protein n=1 Tax=Aquatica leii TaxID=1421715 RepID=A0AAN7PIP0_9COLE|nr:hypothetical protein RN001_003514 [Aquatica leii]
MSNNNSASSADEASTNSKKRRRNSCDWNVNKRKLARQESREYVTMKGVTAPGKKVGPPCTLKFGRCQVDVCSEYERLNARIKDKNLNDTAKRVAVAELMVHKRRAKKFYAKIKEVELMCQDWPEVMGISFDYIQNLPLPNIPRLVKKHDRIYIPQDYETMIIFARKKIPFTVKEIRHNNILDFKKWWPLSYKKTCSLSVHGSNPPRTETFTVSSYRQFLY